MARQVINLGTGVGSPGSDSHYVAHKKADDNFADLYALGAVSYQGVWNASTNSPPLTDGTGTKGTYYKVGTTGSTTLGGNATWAAGDFAVYNGSTWDRILGPNAASNYNLPTASTSTLGGVKVDGSTITINGSGVISAAASGVLTVQTTAAAATLALGYDLLEYTGGSNVNITIPTNASVAFPVGTQIEIFQVGAGIPTVVAAGGVTLQGGPASPTGQYKSVFLRKRATDTWVVQ